MSLISVEAAAGMLGVSRTTAYRMVSDRLIPAVKFMKRGVRVHAEQLQQMIDDAAAASISGAGGIQEATECPTKERTRPIGGSLSIGQMAKELDDLLELPTSRRRKP